MIIAETGAYGFHEENTGGQSHFWIARPITCELYKILTARSDTMIIPEKK